MRFGIDLDGVLADFGSRVVDIGNKIWPGKFPPGYKPDNWNYEGYLTKDEWDQVWATIKATPHFWEHEAGMLGVQQLNWGLKPKDEVFFITARCTTVGEPPAVQSANWLGYRGLWPREGYSTLLQVDAPEHKQNLFPALKIPFFLDDYAPTVAQLNLIPNMRAFVLDQPWNRYATDLPRVHSVAEYLDTIRAL